MSNVSLKMNTQEIFRLNSSTSTIHEDISAYLNDINLNCINLSGYIQSSDLNIKINYIADLIGDIQINFSRNMLELVDFLRSQLNNYEVVTEDATKLLRGALQFIEENFPNPTEQ